MKLEPRWSMPALAQKSIESLEDLLDEYAMGVLSEKPYEDQIEYRYLHADCDQISEILHEITGWPFVALTINGWPSHRAVMAPDGRYLDAGGWQTEATWRKIYKGKKSDQFVIAILGNETPFCTLDRGEDEHLEALAFLLQSTRIPFCEKEFKQKVMDEWGKYVQKEDQPLFNTQQRRSLPPFR